MEIFAAGKKTGKEKCSKVEKKGKKFQERDKNVSETFTKLEKETVDYISRQGKGVNFYQSGDKLAKVLDIKVHGEDLLTRVFTEVKNVGRICLLR